MTSRTALPSNPFRAPERALPATTRLDEFEIERVLAQSSFAVVYRAYDHALKLHVAIKEYLPDALALRSAETQVVLRARTHGERFELGLQAFIDEAQTLARCDHPALLRILRILQRHGTAYRVMRYSPGSTLLAHRRALAATPDARALRIWLDALLGALDALHEEGCVHAAVAPGSILLLPGDRPMLLDFDAVPTALISDRTQSMMAALEPCFEPVEQRAPTGDIGMGPWTDLYALAATLHFCIGGQLPAPPTGATAAQAFEPLVAVWQRLRSARPALGDAPHWLNALDACLLETPAQRPQSVSQLRGLLEVGASAPVMNRPVALQGVRALEGGSESLTAWSASLPVAHAVPRPAGPGASQPAIDPWHGRAAPAARLEPRPRAAAAGAAAAAAAAQATRPALANNPTRAPVAIDPMHAKVMADLDRTFAFIAAQANEDAAQADGNTAPGASAAAVAAGEGARAGAGAGAGAGSTAGAGAGAHTATAAPEPAPMDGPASARPARRRQLWVAGAAALLMLVAMAAAVAWLVEENQAGLVGGGGVDKMQSLSVPALAPANGAGGSGSTAREYAPPAAGPATRNGSAAAQPAPADALAGATKPRPPPASPREACGERTRFALFQCMQTQCTKPAWTKHAQCVSLRKEQKLG